MNVRQGCPKDWKEYGNSCYLFVTLPFDYHPMTWKESRANCKQYGAELVSIHNSLEADFIRQQISATSGENYEHFWIGLYRSKTTDDPKEGWEWSDGSNFTNPLQWNLNEPEQNEDCGVVFPLHNGLDSSYCLNYFSRICKRKKGNFCAQ